MAEPVTIVARRRYGKTDCIVRVTYHDNPEVEREVNEMIASFILHNMMKKIDPAV